MDNRAFDIILFGATGFTGQLVVQYLAAHVGEESFRLAIAGRDTAKLEQIRAALPTSHNPIGLIRADVHDEASLLRMAEQGKVLMSTVGPYNWYGESLIKACVTAKTNYLDITGEPAFVHGMYKLYHQPAMAAGISVVNCCGFDSIPADLGVWLTAKVLPVDQPKTIRAYIRTNASFSGGTWTTAIHALYQRAQNGERLHSGPKHPDTPLLPLRIHFNKELKRWAIPMPVVDPHIVKRSMHNVPQDYGVAVAYGQFFTVPRLLDVVKIILPIAAIAIGVRIKLVRNWLFSRFPPGTGPTSAKRAASTFEVRVIGTTHDHRAETIISGGDPGYDETAKMLSQASFTLLHRLRTERLVPGVRTPVEALGDELVIRLRTEGIKIATK
jgi:short subunit dehydrogenase-like uncharacterized protein